MRQIIFVFSFTLLLFAVAGSVEDQEGWPVIIGEGVHSSPNMADLDGNGTPEVIVAGCAIGQVYVIRQDGTLFPGWPQKTGQMIFSSSPAVGDIDGDGDFEIIIGSDQHKVYAWHHDGRSVRNWPVPTDSSARSSPLLGDLDRDGDLEIIIGTNDGKVNAWHHDGSCVDHWPQRTRGAILTAPASGDLDNDGDLEIICGSEDGFLSVWHHDGSQFEGWPVEVGIFRLSSPVLGDVDKDGFLEIVAFSPERGTLYLLNHDGSHCDGWPVRDLNTRHSSSPSLGDLNGDGDLEVLIGGDQAYAFQSNGSPVPGWPIPLGTYIVGLGSMKGFSSTIAIGDIDGDGLQEAVVNGADQNAYAFHWNGQSVRGWPVWTDDYGYATPLIGNLDYDKNVELIVGQGGERIFAWDCFAAYNPQHVDWPQFRHDMRNTGRLGPDMYEPDNCPIEAQMIQTGGHVRVHNLYAPGDEDWIVFGAAGGNEYVIRVTDLGRQCAPRIAVYDSDGITLLAESPEPLQSEAPFRWRAPHSARYFLQIRNHYSEAIGLETQYRVSIKGTHLLAPTGLEATAGEGSVILSWCPRQNGAKGYTIYYAQDSQNIFREIDVGPRNTYRVTGLLNSCQYRFRVCVYDARRKESPYSKEVTATPLDLPPSAPVDFIVTSSDQNVLRLWWKPNPESDIAGYRVHWGSRSGQYERTRDVGKDGRFELLGFPSGQSLFFSLTAYDFSGKESDLSREVSACPMKVSPTLEQAWSILPSRSKRMLNLPVEILIVSLVLCLTYIGFRYGPFRSQPIEWIVRFLGIIILTVPAFLFMSKLILHSVGSESIVALFIQSLVPLCLLAFFVYIMLHLQRHRARRKFSVFTGLIMISIVLLMILLLYQGDQERRLESNIETILPDVTVLVEDYALRTLAEAHQLSSNPKVINGLRHKDKIAVKTSIEEYLVKSGCNIKSIGTEVLDGSGKSIIALGAFHNNTPKAQHSLASAEWVSLQSFESGLGFVASSPVQWGGEICGMLLLKRPIDDQLAWKIAQWTDCDIEFSKDGQVLASTMGGYGQHGGFFDSMLTKILRTFLKVIIIDPVGQRHGLRTTLQGMETESFGSVHIFEPIRGGSLAWISTAKIILNGFLLMLTIAAAMRLKWENSFIENVIGHRARNVYGLAFIGLVLVNGMVASPEASISLLQAFESVRQPLYYFFIFFLLAFMVKSFIFRRLKKPLRLKMSLSYLLVGLLPILMLFFYLIVFGLQSQSSAIDQELKDLEERAAMYARDSFVRQVRILWKSIRGALESPGEGWDRTHAVIGWMHQNQWHLSYDLPDAFATLQITPYSDRYTSFLAYDYITPPEFKSSLHSVPDWVSPTGFCGLAIEKGQVFIKAVDFFQTEAYRAMIEVYIPFDRFLLQRVERKLDSINILKGTTLKGPQKVSIAKGGFLQRINPFVLRHTVEVTEWVTGKKEQFQITSRFPVGQTAALLTSLSLILGLFLLPLLLSAVGGVLSYRGFVKPLDNLIEGIRRLRKGELDYEIELKGSDEFSEVAETFNSMTSDLRRMIIELADKKKLEELSRLKSEFISNVSHELKTPLTSIKGSADNMLDGVAGELSGKQRKYVQMILDSCNRLIPLIDNLLDISRIEAGKISLRYTQVSISKLIEEVRKEMEILAKKKDISLTCVFESGLPFVSADEQRVRQILINLLDNAVKFTPAQGTIEVQARTVASPDQEVVINITDTGVGIQRDHLERIFDKFQQQSFIEQSRQGVGLGLAIVKNLVELQGGRIWVESKVSVGSTFSFTLPVRKRSS
jgi:signal transduction histidine kinase